MCEHILFSENMDTNVLKSRLYFLNHPEELRNADVDRHVCRECRRVFHKFQGLEWHMMDDHLHLVKEVQRDSDLHLKHEEEVVKGKDTNNNPKKEKAQAQKT